MMDENSSAASELLIIACVFRQGLIFALRRGGQHQLVHLHESIALLPISWTIITCVLAIANYLPSFSPSLSEAHLGLVFTPQLLTWYWCLQSRGEITKSDFTAHTLGSSAVIVLLLSRNFVTSFSAVAFSGFILYKNSNIKTRQFVLWFIVVVISCNRFFDVSLMYNTWVMSICEIFMMFIMKFRISAWFIFDKRCLETSKNSLEAASQESDLSIHSSDVSVSPSSTRKRPGGPLLSFDSNGEEGDRYALSLLDLVRSDSSNSQLVRTDSLNSGGRPPGSGHRRGISTQSSGNGWAWGLAVPDILQKGMTPTLSSDEEDEDLA